MVGVNQSLVVLTGAGISAESGLQTFRAEDGLWCDHRVEDVATPEAFTRNPLMVQAFYNMRRRQLKEVEPNAAHKALANLAQQWQGDFLLVTQNVDDLHERAMNGHTAAEGYHLLHMHGELKKARHLQTHEVVDWDGDMDANDDWRPHIVWFGEMPLEMPRIYKALSECDLFVSIGTSGTVYPAAGFVAEARNAMAHTVELNLEPSHGHSMFAETIYGQASDVVPAYVQKILNGELECLRGF